VLRLFEITPDYDLNVLAVMPFQSERGWQAASQFSDFICCLLKEGPICL